MELMVPPLTTQSHTLTPALEEHVTVLQFHLHHVQMDSATICLILYLQYVLNLTA